MSANNPLRFQLGLNGMNAFQLSSERISGENCILEEKEISNKTRRGETVP